MSNSKKPFIFGCGAGWCGTTSLYMTLVENGYLHGGFTKEDTFLSNLFREPQLNDRDYNKFLKLITYSEEIRLGAPYTRIQDGVVVDVCNTEKYLSPLRKFTKSQLEYIFSLPLTAEKYIEYHTLLSEYSDDFFAATGDFNNTNFIDLWEYEQQCDLIINKLSETHNIKFLMILRDPIRAFFSVANSQFYREKIPNITKYNSVKEYMWEQADVYLNNPINPWHDYGKVAKKFKDKFGNNFHYVIMEDFFSSQNNEVQRLEKFLNTKITSIYPCSFVPDKGVHALRDGRKSVLVDQWNNDKEKLSDELYLFIKRHMQEVYDEFEDLHGGLPNDWGIPIDYGY